MTEIEIMVADALRSAHEQEVKKPRRNRRRDLDELPIRVCRTLHRCCVCLGDISYGEQYHDGGWPRRAHTACAIAVRDDNLREHTRADLDEIDRKREVAR